MAKLTRKFLTALGIEDENVQDQIITAHRETVDPLKEERDALKVDAEKLEGVQKELDAIKDNGEKDPYKVKYEALKEDFETYKNDVEAKATKAQKEKAMRGLLKDIGVSEKRIDAVLKVTDLEGVQLDENGLKDAEKIKEEMKTEWADFIVSERTTGVQTETPPAKTTGSYSSKAEIMAIKDRGERRKAIAENPSLFGLNGGTD